MLRIVLLIFVGLIGGWAAVRTIAAGVLLVLDLRRGATHAPEIIGTLVGALIVTLLSVWAARKLAARPRK